MRFAYIDSQGNEVTIPSVDALALRIELGAIGPDTELYDAQAERWGPAQSHEIFHTLSRQTGDDGFVAPPPPAPLSGADEAAGDEADAPAGPAGAEPAESGAGEPAEPQTPAGGGDDLGFDLTLTDEGAAEPVDPAPQAPDEGPMEFGLVDDAADEVPAFDLADDGPATDEGGDEADDATFDFGGMDALELEATEEDDGAGEEAEDPAEAGEPAMDFGGGMLMEEPLSDQDGDFSGLDDASGGLELEQPMSEFSSDSPPAWMEQDGPGGDEGAMDFSMDDDAEPAEAADRAPAREPAAMDPADAPRRHSTSRPSPPQRKKERSLVGPLVGLGVVAVVAVGGWFGWQALGSAESGEPEVVALPPVTIPEIPAELLPVMRDLGEEALAGTVERLAALAEEADLPVEPRDDWLSGVYLANASDFSDIRDYWVGIESFVGRVADADTRIFHEEYEEALAGAGIAGDTAAILLERADSGFLATREARFEVYAQMDDLVRAALELHEFLLQNEAEIAYDPAAGGVSADPVLEAVPSSRALGNEMWDRVDAITAALDRLGTLDRVTTERLTAVLFDRIRRAGFE